VAYSRPQSLAREHDRGSFACGAPELDRWLTDHALGAQASGSARVFVSTDGSRVVGYYALAAAQLQPGEAAVLLARLAVDQGHQGSGLGRSLLQDAMLRTDAAAEELGIRLMLVHAKHEEAGRWYRGFGFEESPTDPLHLMLLMKDLRAYLSAAEDRSSTARERT